MPTELPNVGYGNSDLTIWISDNKDVWVDMIESYSLSKRLFLCFEINHNKLQYSYPPGSLSNYVVLTYN